MQSPEDILGLPPSPGRDEIRRAYRALARRWHPDRFTPGPEREWAGEHMARINSAYRELMSSAGCPRCGEEDLEAARGMIKRGELSRARETLIAMTTRRAEWNYLFGVLLIKLSDYRKAVIYLSVAAHQDPLSEEYAQALARARRLASSLRKPSGR